jgi:hypothetical protein
MSHSFGAPDGFAQPALRKRLGGRRVEGEMAHGRGNRLPQRANASRCPTTMNVVVPIEKPP